MITGKEVAEQYLEHYGVKGMKWGKRVRSEDSAKNQPLKKKKSKELTTKELKDSIERMRLEKQFKDLNPNKVIKGDKIALSILAVGATANTAFTFANSPAGKAVGKSIATAVAKSIPTAKAVSTLGT